MDPNQMIGWKRTRDQAFILPNTYILIMTGH